MARKSTKRTGNLKQHANNVKSNPRNTNRGASNTVKSKGDKSTEILAKASLPNKGLDNDPNWYFTDQRLADQAAELSFQQFIGSGNIIGTAKLPSIARIDLNPCPGVSYDITPQDSDQTIYSLNNGLNLMTNKIYTLLSTYSGRSSNYAPQDVGIMLLSISAMTEWSEHIRRVFGLALTYNQRNRVVPRGLIQSMGIDADDLFANIANYRMRFNIALTRINQIPLLANIGFIAKSRDLYQKVYLDDPSSMAQIYYYNPNSTWVLDEESDSKGSMLETVKLDIDNADPLTRPHSIVEWLEVLERQIDALLNSSTLNIIYADLINLGSKMNVQFWKFDYLAENYTVIPEYNANFLLQVHNMSIIGEPDTSIDDRLSILSDRLMLTKGNNVYCEPDTNSILYNPCFGVKTSNSYDLRVLSNCIVDMDNDMPTLVDRIEALRFKIAHSGKTHSVSSQKILGYGYALPDHYAVRMTIFTDEMSTRPEVPRNDHLLGSFIPSGLGNNMNILLMLSKFNHAPIIYTKTNITGLFDVPEAFEGDVNFPTVVDYTYLNRLNKLVYVGLFEFRV